MSDELDRPSRNVAPPSGEGETPAPVGGDSAGCRPEHGLRTGAGGIGEAPESAGPDRTTRYLDTAAVTSVESEAEMARRLPEVVNWRAVLRF